MATKKILILGGSSYVGKHLFSALKSENSIATYCRTPIVNGIHFDSLNMKLSDILSSPETISTAVILLGDTNPETCAENPEKSNALNVESIKSIIKELIHLNIKPVFASSEFVFDGTKGSYIETDPANPILLYGKQKLEIENYLKENCDNYIITRFAKIFGTEPGDKTLFTNWLESISQNQTIKCANDQIFSPVHIKDVVESIIKLIENDCNGTYHIASSKPYSRLDLLNTLLEEVKKSHQTNVNIIHCSIHDFNLKEKRPLNVSMNPDKLIKAVGIPLHSITDICENIAKSYNNKSNEVQAQ